MHESLYLAGRHLVVDLPYTLSTMRNNHLIGDGLGLVALGRAFQGDRAARRWVRLGDRLIAGQIARHFRSDGSSIEDSLAYNRFVLEMLAARVLLGDAPAELKEAMKASAAYLVRLGVLDGPVPQFGDWDEGRVLTVAEKPEDVDGSVRLALALAGTGAPRRWAERHDEVAWYATSGEPASSRGAITDGDDAGGAIARAQSGAWTVWLKAGSGPSHGHADLLSTPIRDGRQWVIGDPGTGTYNGAIAQRNYFRSSIAHSVTRLGGVDQLEPHRAFRWRHVADGKLGEGVVIGDTTIMWGIHSAYERLNPSQRLGRVVASSPEGVMVADWVEGVGPFSLVASLPLSPDAIWDGHTIRFPDGATIALGASGEFSSVSGGTEPFDGWWSETYGSMVPSTRLEIVSDHSPIAWTVSKDRPLRLETSDGDIILGDLVIGMRFGRDVLMSVRAGNTLMERTLV
jgi:hypothetical protein